MHKGRASTFLEIFENSNLKLNTNTIHSIFLLSSSASRANLSSVGATIFTSLAFLSSSVSMTNLSRLVAASFSSLALSSSVSMANLSCLLVTTFSSLKLLSNSLSSPRFHLLRVGRRCYSVVFCFLTFASYPQHTEAPFAEAPFSLSFSFLSERFFFVHAKAAIAYGRNE